MKTIKTPTKPTRRQKSFIAKSGYNPNLYGVVEETDKELIIYSYEEQRLIRLQRG